MDDPPPDGRVDVVIIKPGGWNPGHLGCLVAGGQLSADDPAATPLRPPDWHSGLQDTAACARFDPSVPHPARVYAYWLGGKDHDRADRKVAEEVMRRRPQVVAHSRTLRTCTPASPTLDFSKRDARAHTVTAAGRNRT